MANILEILGVGDTQKRLEKWFNTTAITGIATTVLLLILILISKGKK